MVYDYFDKFTFLCEMYDEAEDDIKDLVLNFFPFDNSVQVIDPKKGKNLVKRVQLPPLSLEMLQIGNIINVFSKLLQVKDCSPATKRNLFNNYESTFALIKPIPANEHGKVITFIMKHGFRIIHMKNGRLSKDFVLDMYRDIDDNRMLPIIIDYLTSGEVIGLVLESANAIEKWRECLGSTDPSEALSGTLRNLYGKNKLENVAHGCKSPESVKKVIDLYFGFDNGIPRVPFQATFKNCTCCIIKPHVLIDGNVGAILEQIVTFGKFYISAIAMFSVSLTDATEFYELYKGVLPEYEDMCVHLAEGKCIALEVKCTDSKLNCVCEFRKECGPRDPDLCRQLYPNSIRAQYGKSIVHNAVHCSDLTEEGEIEVKYFFKLLATK